MSRFVLMFHHVKDSRLTPVNEKPQNLVVGKSELYLISKANNAPLNCKQIFI